MVQETGIHTLSSIYLLEAFEGSSRFIVCLHTADFYCQRQSIFTEEAESW